MSETLAVGLKRPRDELRVLAATACLGYGYTEEALARALSLGVDVIGADAGSMDPGPYYLGAGKPYVSEAALERDLRHLLVAARKHGIPLVIGSAGGSGGEPHLDLSRRIIERIVEQEGLALRLAVIHAEPPRDLILSRLRERRIQGLWPAFELTEAAVTDSTRIVAMMGAEPLQRALAQGVDVVLAGRCSDSAIYAALPLMRGFDPGLAWHMGKTIECGATIATPKTGQDCIIGVLGRDHFTVEPGHPDKRCLPAGVAAHTMYENPSPYEFVEPSGLIDTEHCRYEAVDERSVRVSGSRYTPAPRYTVKLEGAMQCGWRAVTIAGIRDPILISRIREFTRQIQERVAREARQLGLDEAQYTLSIRRYGMDAVLGDREPRRDDTPWEIGLLLEVVARTAEAAEAVLAKARYIAMHTEFEGRLCSAGNMAVPFSPSDVLVGPAYRFTVWHAMELEDPLEVFPMEMIVLDGRKG